MCLDTLSSLVWLAPWRPTPSGLEIELEREVGKYHPLFGREAIAVVQRFDNDDVLFIFRITGRLLRWWI